MAIYQLKTFEDIYKAILEEVKEQESATTDLNRIKRDINICYLDEIVPFKRWWWLRGHTDVDFPAYLSTGTATVTSASPAITLTEGFGSSQKNNYFSVDGTREIYKIKSHTAASTSLVLDRPYRGTTSSTASFKIWQDFAPLPTNCKETFEVWHDHNGEPLRGIGFQDYRKISAAANKAIARPVYYSTGDFHEESAYDTISGLPASTHRISTGRIRKVVFASAISSYLEVGDRIEISGSSSYYYNSEAIVSAISTTTVTNDTVEYIVPEPATESSTADTAIVIKLKNVEGTSERFRKLHVYPYLYSSTTTLHVDYVIQAPPLENASDEPLMPLEDRVALLYGTLSRTWARYRNPEEAARNKMLYEQKLARMAAKTEDSLENPTLRPSRIYLGVKRNEPESFQNDGGWGEGSSMTVSGTANRAAQFNASGEISSSDITTTELGYLDNVTSNIQTQLDAITTLADGKIYLGNSSNVATEVTPSGDVTISNAGVTAITAGVIVNADVNASAAIAYSKLNLASSIVNADVSGSAAIAYSKLNLASSIVNADVAAGAAIAYSKLNLATSIVNADVAVAAAIARTKLASGTADHVLINDASGVASSEAALSPVRGGTGVANNAAATLTRSGNHALTITTSNTTNVTLPTTGTLSTLAGSESLTNKTLDNTNTVTLKDTLFTIQDDGDTTKQAKFQASSITTGTTRTLTIPDADLTITGIATTQNLTNKTLDNTNTVTLKDTLFTLQDDGDTTKQAKFQLSGLTTGTTRTITLPDADFTAVGTATTQTLTNKTLTTPVFSGTPTGTITQSTYTPTATEVDNVNGTITPTVATYYRVGNVVTVFGGVSLRADTAGLRMRVRMSLPIASDFTTAADAGGSGATAIDEASNVPDVVAIDADATNNEALFWFVAPSATVAAGAENYIYHYSYVIK